MPISSGTLSLLVESATRGQCWMVIDFDMGLRFFNRTNQIGTVTGPKDE